ARWRESTHRRGPCPVGLTAFALLPTLYVPHSVHSRQKLQFARRIRVGVWSARFRNWPKLGSPPGAPEIGQFRNVAAQTPVLISWQLRHGVAFQASSLLY